MRRRFLPDAAKKRMFKDWIGAHLKTAVQKWAFGFLLIFGVSGLVFGISQTRARILFPPRPEKVVTAPALSEEELLRSKDTDKDGLSDFDELYLYRTSPYIADSDSDGVNDAEEIKRGTNPSCPEGKVCAFDGAPTGGGGAAVISGETASGASIAGENNTIRNAVGAGASTETNALVRTSLSAAEIRAVLSQAGVPDAQLKKFDDATIIKLYEETLAEQKKKLETSNTAPTKTLP